MDLRTLIPSQSSVAGPVLAIVGDERSGLMGVATRLGSQDYTGAATSLGALFQERLAGVLPAEGGAPFSGALGAVSRLSGQTLAPPSDLLLGLERTLGDAGGAVERLPQIVQMLTGIAADVERARGGDLGPVVRRATEALNAVVLEATGPDLAGFQDWRRYLEQLAAEIRPLIEAGGTPDEVRVRLLGLALARVRDAVLGLAPLVADLRSSAETTLAGLLPDVPALGLTGLRDAAVANLGAIRTAAEGGAGDMTTLVGQYRTSLRTLTDAIHNALDSVEASLDNPVLTPGGVADLAGRELDRILAMRVDDYSDVVERVEGFFQRIEQAIDAVDLSAVTGPITGFLQQVQDAFGRISPEAVQGEIDSVAARIDEVVSRLEETLVALQARIQGWLSDVAGQIDAAIASLGEMGADGRFHFSFESELDGLYARADALIQGDPAHPDAFSIKKALQDFQATFNSLVAEAESAIADLAAQLTSARDQLAASLNDVRSQIVSVDPKAVMDQAKAALEDAFQRIGDLEFDAVVDPVVSELNEARDKLAAIDVSSLNEILRAALRAALEVVRRSDFDQEIKDALLEEFDRLLEKPREVLQAIGDKVNELVKKVTDISPEALLKPVQEQLDRVTAALDVDFQKLLKPLVDAYERFKAEASKLDPAQLLQPLNDAFHAVTSAVDSLRPEALLQPAQAEIDRLGAAVSALDLDRAFTPVNAVFGDINRFLDGLNPAELLRPLDEPFNLLERAVEPLRPSVLLAPVVDIMGQLGSLTDEIPDAVLDQIRALYEQAIARADSLDPTPLFNAVRSLVGEFRSRFDQLRPAAVLTALQGEFAQTRALVATADTRNGTSFVVSLDEAAPTTAFGAVIGRYERIAARLDAIMQGLDPAPLQARYLEARSRIEELLPTAIRGDITSGRLRALLGLMDPAHWIERLDAIYQRIVDKVGQLRPSTLLAPLTAAYQSLRAALSAVDLGALLSRARQTLERVGELVRSISLQSIFAPILDVVNRLKAVVGGLDPAPLIEALRARFQALVALLDEVSPLAMISSLQDAWERTAERIRGLIDLETIAEPLIGVFNAIKELLGGLDAGELIGVLDDKLDKLRDELEEALTRTGSAFKEMLTAAPV